MNKNLEQLISQQAEVAKGLHQKDAAKLRGKREDYNLLVERGDIRKPLEEIILLVAAASPGISLYGVQSALNLACGYEYKLRIPRRGWKGGYSRSGVIPVIYISSGLGSKEIKKTITPTGEFYMYLYREPPTYDPTKIAIRRRWDAYIPGLRGNPNSCYKDYALVEVADFSKKVEELFEDVLENSEPCSEEEVRGINYPGNFSISYGKVNIEAGAEYLRRGGLARVSWNRKSWE